MGKYESGDLDGTCEGALHLVEADKPGGYSFGVPFCGFRLNIGITFPGLLGQQMLQ